MIEDEKKKAKAQPISEPNTPVKNESEIQDVNLGFVEKKKFRINGDNDRVLELNISDLNIFSRFTEGYPKLQQLLKDAQEQVNAISFSDSEEDDGSSLTKIADVLTDIDKKMRAQLDYIFDSNVSEICAPSGNMFDPVNGEFRFEHIINVVAGLYTNGLSKELDSLKKKTAKHTSKYTKKYHK